MTGTEALLVAIVCFVMTWVLLSAIVVLWLAATGHLDDGTSARRPEGDDQ